MSEDPGEDAGPLSEASGPSGPLSGASDPSGASPFPSGVPASSGAAPETIERFGRPMRHFPVAVSTEAMALAWANREDGPAGAVVVVDHEIGPRGYHGVIWATPPADSLACSVILRPTLAVEEADASWLAVGLIAIGAAEAASGHELSLWWPAQVVEGPERDLLASVKAEIQLGPGRVKSVVATMRFDLVKLGLGGERRDEVLERVVGAVDEVSDLLAEGAAAVAAAYEARCSIIGKRLKVRLRPKGETRGTVRSIDRSARLEIASPTGMAERIGIDQLMELTVV